MSSETLLIAAAAIAAFVLFWIALAMLIGALSGWRALAQAYSAGSPFAGTWIPVRRARLGLASYKGGSLRAAADPMGLHLAAMILFRPGHPPLFIPWGDIRTETAGGAAGPATLFRFARSPKIILQVTEADADAILRSRAYGGLVP